MCSGTPRGPESPPARRSPAGFRCSALDGFVLALAAAGAFALWPVSELLGFLVVMTVGHFFLFCNVIRMRRRRELTWAALFVANCIYWWVVREDLRILPVLAVQLPITALLALREIRSGDYRGVGSRIGPA